MNKLWTDNAWDDYLYWQQQDRKTLRRINALLSDIERNYRQKGNAYTGIGKPEPLKYEFQGFWSRRIDETNRLIYRVNNDVLEILMCRTHYGTV